MALHRLHHRSECEDIRSAYDSDKSHLSDYSRELSHHRCVSGTDRSHQTQPTDYSATSVTRRPPRVHYPSRQSCEGNGTSLLFPGKNPQDSPRASVETYASTVTSEEDEMPKYTVPDYTARPYEPRVTASTPTDFSELFPSHRKLNIRHDDSTLDGNMNLRVDTEVTWHGCRRGDMTLFHLRMHDLRAREFSLRRYCRDSGREVCHSVRQRQKPTSRRPSFHRSLSNALSSMRTKSDPRTATTSSLKRHDSGYDSARSSLDVARDDRPLTSSGSSPPQEPIDDNAVRLEFSNYAQVEVRRSGGKTGKGYALEYWGISYAWKRVTRKHATGPEVSYHLTKAGSDQVLAYVIPARLTPEQAKGEQSRGGWVPPCSMWIADESIVRGQKDVADVIVASGLIAVVDDCIRARFHSQASQHLMIPTLQMGGEYVGPKRLINEMFKREGSGQHSRQNSRLWSGSRPSSSHRS